MAYDWCTDNSTTDIGPIISRVVKLGKPYLGLAIAGKQNLIVKHYDAKTAFLNGELDQPEGYEAAHKEGMVCKLKKGLYGLKQAAKL